MMGVHAMLRHDWHWVLLLAAVVLLDQASGQEVSTNAVTIAEQAPYLEGVDARGVRMRCIYEHDQAEGFAYVWRRNGGAALPDDGSRFALTAAPLSGSHFFIGLLNLSSADVWSEQDAGTYTCDAVDQRTNTTLSTGTLNLVIEVRAEVTGITPPAEARLGVDITLACNARGSKPLTYTWTGSGGVVLQQATSNQTVDMLVIADTTRNDTADYSCSVSNRFASAERMTRLDVIELPDLGQTFSPTARVVGGQLRQITVDWTTDFFDGNTPILSYTPRCVGVGTNDIFRPVPSNLSASARSFTFNALHPGRTYSCDLMVENKLGPVVSQASTVTVLEERPNASPTILTVTPTTAVSMEVTWQGIPAETHFGVLLGYSVLFAAQGCGTCPCTGYSCRIASGNVTVPIGTTQATLPLLRRYTAYDVTVTAFNSAGGGSPSAVSTAQTLEYFPEAATNFAAVPAPGVSGLQLSWTPPVEANGVISRYDLAYDSLDQNFLILRETLRATEGLSQATVQVQVVNLRPSTTYRFSLQAVNSVGFGRSVNTTGSTEAFPVLTIPAASQAFSAETRETVLQCTAVGEPAPAVVWQRAGNATRVPAEADGSLRLLDLRESDTGTYVCTATNTWGSRSANVSITVLPASSGYIISGFKDTYLFICIGAGVVLVMIISTVCILRCRRRSGSGKSPSFASNGHRPNTHLSNPHFEDPGSQPSSPPQYPKPAPRSLGGNQRSLVTVTGPDDASDAQYDGYDGEFSHTATFQQQNDQLNHRQIVTPIATMNNQHGHQPSALSSNSFLPASLPPNDPKLTTSGPSFQNETSFAAPSYDQFAPPSRNVNQGYDPAANEQLPTYTARHGDHILTAM